MRFIPEMVERFPEAESEELVASMTGHVLATHLWPKRRQVRGSAYLTDAAMYIERRSFLRHTSYHRLPIDKVDDFGWGSRPDGQSVIVFGMNDESYALFLPVGDTDADANFTQTAHELAGKLLADPTSALSRARRAEFEKKANMAHLIVTGWELLHVPEGDSEAERRAIDAKAAVFDNDPDMINRIISQLEKFEKCGVDITMQDVQTMALRRAGYLRARGLTNVLVDFENPK